MRRYLLSILVAAGCCLGLAPGLASAAPGDRCQAPPGTGAVDQYCETVPGAGGERSPGGSGGGGSGGGGGGGGAGGGGSGGGGPAGSSLGSTVDRATAARLAREGADGQGVLALPSEARSGARKSNGRGAQGAGSAEEPSSNPLDAVGSAIEAGTTTGSGFVWLLAVIALLMGAAAWLRYRRRPQS